MKMGDGPVQAARASIISAPVSASSTPSLNGAVCNCLALAAVLHRHGGRVAEATRHFALHREDALRAVLDPG